MPKPPDESTQSEWHRYFAQLTNNAAWDLADQPERTPLEARQMLYLAYAAAYHWSQAGAAIHQARAEVTLAHVHALLGEGEQAHKYARSALDFFETQSGEDWDLAFACLEMAFAAAVQGDSRAFHTYTQRAQELAQVIRADEDRKIVLHYLQRLPSIPEFPDR